MFLIIFSVTIASTADVTLPKVKIEQENSKPKSNVATGYWKISGDAEEGKRYTGIVYLVQQPGTKIYMLKQNVGIQQSDGIGVWLDEKLVISWKYTDNKIFGLTYVSFKNGSGVAKWISLPGSGSIQEENWNFLTGADDE